MSVEAPYLSWLEYLAAYSEHGIEVNFSLNK